MGGVGELGCVDVVVVRGGLSAEDVAVVVLGIGCGDVGCGIGGSWGAEHGVVCFLMATETL